MISAGLVYFKGRMKMRILFAVLVVATMAFAETTPRPVNRVPTDATEFELNRSMGPAGLRNLLGTVLRQAHNTAIGTWDYSVSGFASNGQKSAGITLPNKAIISRVWFDVVTQPTPAGVSVGWGAQSGLDLKSSTAASSWTGRVAGTPDGTVGNMIKLTASRQIFASVAGSTATAGKIKVYIDYVTGE